MDLFLNHVIPTQGPTPLWPNPLPVWLPRSSEEMQFGSHAQRHRALRLLE